MAGFGESLAASSIAWTEFLNGPVTPLEVGRVEAVLAADLKQSASREFATGMSGSELAVAVGFALPAMLEVIPGQRQPPF